MTYSINPWMKDNADPVSAELAWTQWSALRETIAERAEVVLIEPSESFPDMVFTADAGVVYNGRAATCRFLNQERRGEEQLFERWFTKQGFKTQQTPAESTYEGGDALLDPEEPWLWAGYGQRSSLSAHRLAGAWLDREVLPIKLVDPRFYHIDTCFSALTGGYVMYYPPALDSDAQALVEARVPAAKRIIMDADDAMQFACNAVNIGDAVILNYASKTLKSRLAAAGFQLLEREVGEFIKAGGAAKCLTLKL